MAKEVVWTKIILETFSSATVSSTISKVTAKVNE